MEKNKHKYDMRKREEEKRQNLHIEMLIYHIELIMNRLKWMSLNVCDVCVCVCLYEVRIKMNTIRWFA